MAIILHSEYGNVNAARKYPFADSATLKDADGLALPLDFIVDACLYPLTQGLLYVSVVDVPAQRLTLADTVSGAKVADVVYRGGGAVNVFESGGYGRQLGVIVFGNVDGVAQGRGQRTFTAAATVFAPAACTPVQQAGVQGLLLPDGSLMTGDIVIRGEGGVRVRTFAEGPVQVLIFDVVGVPAPDLTECEAGAAPAICTLAVEQEQGSKIVAWKYDDNALGLALANTQLRAQGLAEVKGNIATFDADGYAALLARLRDQRRDEIVYAPYFDRSLEESIGSAIRVDGAIRLQPK